VLRSCHLAPELLFQFLNALAGPVAMGREIQGSDGPRPLAPNVNPVPRPAYGSPGPAPPSSTFSKPSGHMAAAVGPGAASLRKSALALAQAQLSGAARALMAAGLLVGSYAWAGLRGGGLAEAPVDRGVTGLLASQGTKSGARRPSRDLGTLTLLSPLELQTTAYVHTYQGGTQRRPTAHARRPTYSAAPQACHSAPPTLRTHPSTALPARTTVSTATGATRQQGRPQRRPFSATLILSASGYPSQLVAAPHA
jgi:hypothetical protein